MISFAFRWLKFIWILLYLGCSSWQIPETGQRAPIDQKPTQLEVLSDVDVAPRVLRSVRAIYPEIARKARLTGYVQLKFMVRENGSVGNVQVLRGQEIFRQAAIDAIMKYEFSTPLLNNKPVSVWMTMPIEFKL